MLNKIELNGSVIIDDNSLFGGVICTSELVSDNEWRPGKAPSSSLRFTTTYDNLAYGNSITWSTSDDGSTYTQRGVFNVISIERQRNKYTVQCFDNMYLLDNIDFGPYWYTADGSETEGISPLWYDTYTGTYTLLAVFRKIREVVGTSYMPLNPNFNNDDFVLDKMRFSCNGMSCRLVLAYLAGVAGGYAYADSTGVIRIKSLATNSPSFITRNDYREAIVSDISVSTLSGITASNTLSSEVIKSSGEYYEDDTNLLKIVGNPFLFFDNSNKSSVVEALNNIYDVLPSFSFKPFLIFVYTDDGLKIGDKIKFKYADYVNGTLTEVDIVSIIFEKVVSSTGVLYTCKSTKYANQTTVSSNARVIDSTFQVLSNTVDGFMIEDPTTHDKTLINGAKIKTGTVACNSIVVNNDLTLGNSTIASNQLGAVGAKKLYLTRDVDTTQEIEDLQRHQYLPTDTEGGFIRLLQPTTASSSSTSITHLTTEGVDITWGTGLHLNGSWMSIINGGGGGGGSASIIISENTPATVEATKLWIKPSTRVIYYGNTTASPNVWVPIAGTFG